MGSDYDKAYDKATDLEAKLSIAKKAYANTSLGLFGASKSDWKERINLLTPLVETLKDTPASAEDIARQYALNDPEAISQMAAKRARMAANLRKGFSSTLLGGRQGAFGLPILTNKTVLGA